MYRSGASGILIAAMAVVIAAGCSAPVSSRNAPAPAGDGGDRTAAAGASPAPGSATAPPAPVAVRFGLNTTGAAVAPVLAAKAEGIFARHGLDVEPVVIPGPERIAAALLSGEIQSTVIAAPALLAASLAGADLVFYGSYNNQVSFRFYARPEIASVSELRGKTIAITSRGGILKRATDHVLERNGLDPDRDVTMLSVGTVTEGLMALLTGGVEATMQGPPGSFRAEDEGMRMLADVRDYRYMSIMTGVAARRGWLAEHEEHARLLLQGLAEGIVFAREQPERTKQLIGQFTQSDDQVLIERTYNAVRSDWQRTMRVPLDVVQADLKALELDVPAAKDARAEQFIENRFAEALERAGIVEQLPR